MIDIVGPMVTLENGKEDKGSIENNRKSSLTLLNIFCSYTRLCISIRQVTHISSSLRRRFISLTISVSIFYSRECLYE